VHKGEAQEKKKISKGSGAGSGEWEFFISACSANVLVCPNTKIWQFILCNGKKREGKKNSTNSPYYI